MRNEGIHGGFLILDILYSSSFLIALWLADSFEVVFLATCFACLNPCVAHPWLVAWSSSTMLVITTTSTCILLGSCFNQSPFTSVCSGQSGYTLGPFLSVICRHPKHCYVSDTGNLVLASHGHLQCFSVTYVLFQGLQRLCFSQHICL